LRDGITEFPLFADPETPFFPAGKIFYFSATAIIPEFQYFLPCPDTKPLFICVIHTTFTAYLHDFTILDSAGFSSGIPALLVIHLPRIATGVSGILCGYWILGWRVGIGMVT